MKLISKLSERLTIGVPTYNGGDKLPGLFASVQKLGLGNMDYEILVVDNNSDDNTDEIIKQYSILMPNLRYYKNKHNIGRIENWNKVIEEAKGDYLIIMNVNDRFMEFDAGKTIQYLDEHPDISVILTDIKFEDHIYPNWIEYGVLRLDDYLKKTFLEPDYLEFHSVGLLHQHIFRTNTIINSNIKFDPKIPRTTDRVFVGEVIAASGGSFYYINQTMVSWHLSSNRYHYSVHNNQKSFNFNELWIDEYEANIQLAQLASISYKDVLKSQMVLASFFMHVKQLRYLKDKILGMHTPTKSLEIHTAGIFYCYLKTMAHLNSITINYTSVRLTALARALRWYLRSLNISKKKQRTLNDIIRQAELV